MNQFSVDPKFKVGEHVYKTEIPGLLFFEHKKFDDERGFYAELSRTPEIDTVNGWEFSIKQVNLAFSKKKCNSWLSRRGLEQIGECHYW